MKKSLLILLFTLFCTAAFAQLGGVEGRVVSRTGRTAIEGAKVLAHPGERLAETDRDGRFVLDGLAEGEYMLTFAAFDFEPLTLTVRVDRTMRDINFVILAPELPQESLDDSAFSEFDIESGNDASSIPTSLSASRDVFTNIASYRFSEMRFNVRGYDSQYSDVYLNGIRFNDAMTGYTPWSLWGGLNDATRNQNITTGLTMSDFGVGGIAGTTNINARASQLRKGLNVGFVTSNQMYRVRLMATYASGLLDNGWSYAFSVSTRQGGNDYVKGIYYNAYAYFLSAEKIFDPQHRLSFTFLASPTERGAQQAATQETYDLVGNNYYNPNVGYQNGKLRNTRVRDYHEPVAVLNYTFDMDDRTQLNLATSFRFGQNGYSALTWFTGPDPRPDYYRNLPSYWALNSETEAGYHDAAWQADRWMRNEGGIRYFDFDRMFDWNRGWRDADDQAVYGDRARSNYIIEERHTDQLDWNLAAQLSHLFRDNSKVTFGGTFRVNRTSYYDQVKDLLGGDYWVDVDKFAERDFPDPVSAQNDLDYYNAHGYARAATKGDKISYNYKAHVRSGNIWAAYNARYGGFTMNLGLEVGGKMMWRDGVWKKGLFQNDSQGESERLKYFTYRLKGNFEYAINANHAFEANIALTEDAPEFQSAFVSPRTRNSVTPGLSTEKVFAADASYNVRYGDLKLRLSGYYTTMRDGSRVVSFYDDRGGNYTNFAMSGIDKKFFGLELGAQIPLYKGLSLLGALSWGQYTYDSNPYYEQIADNSATPLDAGKVYWKDKRIESTPQLAANVGLSYRSSRNLFVSVNLNYYDNMYLSMNPYARTDNVILTTMTDEQVAGLRYQEKFKQAFTLSASIGKNWSIQRRYTLGASLEVKNILNNQDIKTGGYEQMRVSQTSFERFDSKYFYMFGTTYYLNIYFRF